jgi:hypothetical protein
VPSQPERSSRLRQRHMWVLCAVLLIALPFGQRALLSAALGGAISIVNLRLLEHSVQRLLGGPQGPQPLALRLLLHLRLVFLFGLIAAVLLRTRLEPLAFTAGLSSAVPAVLWHGWKTRYL